MSFFKKELDVLDLTDLQKRGLLKKAEEIKKQEDNSGGYVDFTKSGTSASESPSGANPFDFLGSLSGVGASTPSSQSSSAEGSLEIQSLKNKIEDLEYKLRVLEDTIAKLEGH